MVVDEQVDKRHDEEEGTERLWCYLVVLRGRLCAIPDEEHTVLMPHINRLAAVTPLPLGLVPPYVRASSMWARTARWSWTSARTSASRESSRCTNNAACWSSANGGRTTAVEGALRRATAWPSPSTADTS